MMRSWYPQKRLLLVGEGNFSFSAGLCQVRGDTAHIIATCYESEDVISRQALAKTNIQCLRDRGAEVHFCVDSTKLKEHFLPSERDFDCIYFNFPHCGRKAGVKKNKELLARFFCSCAEVLAEKGEVHVALCRGQGGTPAEQPVREWHNSWQVVAMAAEGGFILNDVHPFNARDAYGYKSTGYRSQDKSFCVEGALNHIFTQSLPLPLSRPLVYQTELEGNLVSFQVPEVFQNKINRGFLEVNSEHPVRTVNEKLIDGLGKSFPIVKADCPLSLVFQDGGSSPFPLDALWMVPVASRNPDPESVLEKSVRDTEIFPSGFPDWDGTGQSSNSLRTCNWLLGRYYLRPSLLVFLPTVVQQTECPMETFLVFGGLVFRKCKIVPHALPVFHEALFICVVNKGLEDTCMQLLVESLTGTINALLQTAGLKLDCTVDEPDTAELGAFIAAEPQLHKQKYLITLKLASDPELKSCCVGTIGTIPWQPTSIDRETVYASLNLDLLAMHVCGMCDWRMLWTSDERFLGQFSRGNLDQFTSFSLYPPSYTHDLSFWVLEPERFNETELHAIVRRVSCESIVSVQLLDRFQHPDTAQISLCYRLTYQSCDRALTCQQAAAMQMKLREEIVHSLHVTLR